MAGHFLSLSLFIMLLSFFIILNSVSGFDAEKARPVLNSLSSAFSIEKETSPFDTGDIKSTSHAESKGSTLNQINGLFTAHIVGVEKKQNRLGTLLRIRMRFSDFEKEILSSLNATTKPSTRGASGKGFFLPTLVSLLDTKDGSVYKMDMMVSTASKPETSQSNNMAKRIAHLAQAIEEAGLPRKMISAGTGEGEAGMVNLYFRPYIPFNPEGFGEGEAGDDR